MGDLIHGLEHQNQNFQNLQQQEIKVKHKSVLDLEVPELVLQEVQAILEAEERGDHQ